MRRVMQANWLKLNLIILALFGFCAPLAAKPFHHEFGELREYHRHWLAVCPDKFIPTSTNSYERECWASTFSGVNGRFNGDFPGNRLTVSRDRASGILKITFVMVSEDQVDRSRRIGVTFSSGSQDDYVFGERIVTNGNVINEFTFPFADDTANMLDRMRVGTYMRMTIPLITGGEATTHFSLRGLNKALQFTQEYALP